MDETMPFEEAYANVYWDVAYSNGCEPENMFGRFQIKRVVGFDVELPRLIIVELDGDTADDGTSLAGTWYIDLNTADLGRHEHVRDEFLPGQEEEE